MVISVAIFLKFANKETIKFYVNAEEEDKAILLMRQVI
jgi:hypothetical protein